MRVVLTAVEKLDAQYPGLQNEIDAMLRRGFTQGKMQAILRETYGVAIPLPQISKYKLKRWLPRVQRIRGYIERAEAAVEVAVRQGRRLHSHGRVRRRMNQTDIIAIAVAELYGIDWREAFRARLHD